MTEAEWLACTDPEPMLAFVRAKVSERKLRLFAAASFGRLVTLLPDPRQHRGIEVLEELAEGVVNQAACRRIRTGVRLAIPRDDWVADSPPTDHPHYIALMLYREFCSSTIAIHAVQATAGLADGAREQRKQVQSMRCIFGNPFRPVTVDPRWLTLTAVGLARTVYEDRVFDRLPILADALQDAGCDDEQLLAHCRSEGPHVRGCWAVDLVLGKT